MNGFAGASERAISREGDFDQALIFDHFGSVWNLLLAELAARIKPWIVMVEQNLARVLTSSPLRALSSSRDLAFGIAAADFGVDIFSHLQRDRTRAEALLDLDLATRWAVLADAVLSPARWELR